MSQIIKAKVLKGPHQNLIVRISNISTDNEGKKKAACILPNGSRANILISDLEVIQEEKPAEQAPRARSSMPFINGSTGSRSLNQTKSLVRKRDHTSTPVHGYEAAICERCGEEYNLNERRGQEGKITICPDCAHV